MKIICVLLAAVCFAICASGQKIQPIHHEKWAEVEQHIKDSWLNYVGKSERLPFPYSYALEPGTLFYWDLYFINEGLMRQGFMEQAKNNIDNFIYEMEMLGFIPNALGWGQNRSQTPYFSMMVRSYYNKNEEKNKEWLLRAYKAIVAEYEFWTNTNGNTIENHIASTTGLQHFSNHADTARLLDFYDHALPGRVPRPENASLGEKLFIASNRIAEAEVMDFTTRFEGRCLNFAAVDLNANLWQYEMDLVFFERELGVSDGKRWEARAHKRKVLINKYLWSEERGMFIDYDFVNERHSKVASVATLMPLFWGFATTGKGFLLCWYSVIRPARNICPRLLLMLKIYYFVHL